MSFFRNFWKKFNLKKLNLQLSIQRNAGRGKKSTNKIDGRISDRIMFDKHIAIMFCGGDGGGGGGSGPLLAE